MKNTLKNNISKASFSLDKDMNKGTKAKSSPSPFFGQTVACGLFGISDDYIEKYQSLDSRFIKNKSSTFFFEAHGDSMEPLIFEKDILVVDRSIEVMHKRICVFSLDGEMFCKRVFSNQKHLILKSESPNYKAQIIQPDQAFYLFGVVIAIARDIL